MGVPSLPLLEVQINLPSWDSNYHRGRSSTDPILPEKFVIRASIGFSEGQIDIGLSGHLFSKKALQAGFHKTGTVPPIVPIQHTHKDFGRPLLNNHLVLLISPAARGLVAAHAGTEGRRSGAQVAMGRFGGALPVAAQSADPS